MYVWLRVCVRSIDWIEKRFLVPLMLCLVFVGTSSSVYFGGRDKRRWINTNSNVFMDGAKKKSKGYMIRLFITPPFCVEGIFVLYWNWNHIGWIRLFPLFGEYIDEANNRTSFTTWSGFAKEFNALEDLVRSVVGFKESL